MKQWFPYIAIFALAVLLAFSWTSKKEVVIKKHITDTVTILRIDTFIERFPHFISEKIVDTVFIEKTSENALKLPITQKYYNTDSYQAWVSGYRPNLDSINVFNKVVERTVNNTIDRFVYQKSVDWYLNAGSMFIGKKAAPYVGLNVKFKNDLVIGANAGVYEKNMFYGFNIGFKLND